MIRERVRVEPAVEGFTDVDDVGGDTAALRCLGLGVRTSNDDASVGEREESGVVISHARAWMSASGRFVSCAARRALADGPCTGV